MSLIHLSSVGQRPYDFTNTFPQGITLGRHAEICLVGYSGVLKGDEGVDLREDDIIFIIERGHNDCFSIQHSDVSRPLAEQQFAPFSIHLTDEIGDNGLELEPTELAVELTDALNNQDPKPDMVWSVAFNAAPALTFTMECEKKRFPVLAPTNETAGDWVQYGSVVQGTIAPAVGTTQLSVAVGDGGAFLNTEPSMFGDCGQLSASVNGEGWTCQFTNVVGTTHNDMVFTTGITSPPFITMYNRTGKETNMGSGATTPTGALDFAYPRNSSAWCHYGFEISPTTGEVFCIQSATEEPQDANGQPIIGGMKTAEGQQTRTPTGVIASVVATQVVRLNISPRFNPAARVYEMVWSIDNGTGAYVIAHSIAVGSVLNNAKVCPYWSKTAALHQIHCWDTQYITGTTLGVRMSHLPSSIGTGAGTDANTQIMIAFRPLQDIQLLATPFLPAVSPLKQESFNANLLGMEMGYIAPFNPSATTATIGWVSEQKPTELITDINTPFLITCPDLPIRGYVGAGTGGGAESQLLGVGRVRNLTTGNAFSNEPTPCWLKLNNEYNIRLDRLNIVLRDEENKIYKRLLPNFSCWVEFRCPKKQQYLGKERDVSVGATYTNWGGTMSGQNDNHILEHAEVAENPMRNRPN